MTRDQKITFYIFVLAVLMIAWKIYVLYFGYNLFGYIVPPGGDPVNHLSMVEEILAGRFNSGYPALFHLTIAILSRLFSAAPLTVMNVLTPILVILPPIAVYLFLSKSFSRLAGIIGFTVTILASNYGLVAYADGNYPNILAAGFFTPIAFIYIVQSFKKDTKRNIIIAAVFLVLTILTHHLSTALFLVTFVVYLLTLVIWNRYDRITPRLHKVGIALLGFFLIGALVIFLTPVKNVFLLAIANLREGGAALPTDAFLKIPTMAETAGSLGELPFYFGIAALVYVAGMLSRPNSEVNKPAILMILVWFFAIFILSQFKFVSLPSRIAREVGLPLLLAIGVFVDDFVKRVRSAKMKVMVLGLFSILVAMSLVQVTAGAFRSPDLFTKMVWFWPQDKVKTDYINELVGYNQKVLANPASPYLGHFSQGKISTIYSALKDDKTLLEKLLTENYNYILVINGFKTSPYDDLLKRDNSAKEQLNSFGEKFSFPVIKRYVDGSVLYELTPNELTQAQKTLL